MALMLVTTGPAQAAEHEPDQEQRQSVADLQRDRLPDAAMMTGSLEEELVLAERLVPFLDFDGQGFDFDKEAALAAGLEAAHVEQMAASVEHATTLAAQQADEFGILSHGCGGQNSFSVHWWGARLQVTSCVAEHLVFALTAGATAAGIAAILVTMGIVTAVSAPVLGIASLLAGAGAGTVSWLNRHGCGFVLRNTAGVPNWSSVSSC